MMEKNKYWKSADYWFLAMILLVIVFGLVAVSSASAVLSFQLFGNNNYYFIRQVIHAIFGIGVLILFSRIDYHIFRRFSGMLMLFGLLFLLTVHIPGLGFTVGGSKSWINTGWFLIQPAEFVKLVIIIYLAAWFARKREAERNFWFGIVPPLLVVGLALGLTAMQPDIGTATVMVLIIGAILFAAGARWQYLGMLSAIGALGLWLVIKASSSRAARIITYFDPAVDPQGIGYQINQALLAIGSGGFWGLGFGSSRQKHSYLPEPIGDSIFAVMAEEFGFIRIMVLVLLFGAIALRGIILAKHAPDKFGQILVVGVTSWIGLQAIVNIAAIMGLIPFTGVTLPFVSYGGSSLLALCAGVGILLNVSRQRT